MTGQGAFLLLVHSVPEAADGSFREFTRAESKMPCLYCYRLTSGRFRSSPEVIDAMCARCTVGEGRMTVIATHETRSSA